MVAREALQQTLLFPVTRAVARPRVVGRELLESSPQPALLASNHASDIDTPLILAALPVAWRKRTVVAAAADRFYRNHRHAVMTALWINTFPFERGGSQRGLTSAAALLHAGHNVLLYPQATRSAGSIEGLRTGVARVALATSTPLIPIHVNGSAMVMPKGRGLMQRGSVTVAFGRPIFPADGEEPRELLERLQVAIVALSQRSRPGSRKSNPQRAIPAESAPEGSSPARLMSLSESSEDRREREAYLDRVLIGGRERREIVIVDYDPRWPLRFELERDKLLRALGTTARRIEHIGSTAVPGLAAKPVIDVLVAVEDPEHDATLVPPLESAGYELRVREPAHRMFRTPSRDVHVHVWAETDSEVERYVAFRDQLRRSPRDRAAYERLKRELATHQWSDVNEYADAKGELITAILANANA